MSDPRPLILFIEPRRSALSALGQRLCDAGMTVLPAANAADGLALLHRKPVDLLLAELDLPDRPASEIVRFMQGDNRLAEIPTVLITAQSNEQGALEAYESGADDVIAKPFDSDVLIARIRQRLRRSAAWKRLRADNAALDRRVVERSLQLGELREEMERLRRS
ncbi:response regulator transcription factor [Sphingomicrobium lutaoense]|uniref:DNA-binding response OmpR family regulator n=1 Tax=Sphingomicrobium lutaoense TaxID=515949 RepID=A0A839Z076_9SPHN|nr:response regulator [Sphingomicrobium lutaoense]MBB3764666.1 DNA-binding response OmpR family regulator [Sphingomicrobium lutaoense]